MMKKLEVRYQGSHCLGHLVEKDRQLYFEYSKEFLETGYWLSPYKLPLQSGVFQFKDYDFAKVFGLFDDSLPDGWGMLLMDRELRRRGISLPSVSILDRLAYIGNKAMGALSYHPATVEIAENSLVDLHQMSLEVEKAWQGSEEEILPQLLHAGGSPGGARPKVLVARKGQEILSGDQIPQGYAEWIVKFSTVEEGKDAGIVEYLYSVLARESGILMPETDLIECHGEHYFAIKRFDRQEEKRIHMHSFGNLIHSNFRIPSCDYEDLLKITRALTRSMVEVKKNYRQTVFNVVFQNRDDHVKNFSFLFEPEKDWYTSPAYDLTLNSGPGGEHSMTICGEGKNPQREHLLELAKRSNISKREAEQIIDEVLTVANTWQNTGKDLGLSTKRINELNKVILKKL